VSEIYSIRNREDFADLVSSRFIEMIEKALALSHEVNVLLSGGKTPNELYKNINDTTLNMIPWKRVRLGMMDDRISANIKDRNIYNLNSNLISRLPQGVLQICSFNIEQLHYSNIDLVESFDYSVNWDIGWFGMGDDGHIAGLFDSAEVLYETEFAAVSLNSKEDFARVSLKENLLMKCRKRVLLVPSEHRYRLLLKKELGLPIHNFTFDEVYVLRED
jgi:6-phosphogluconolactonase